MKIKVDQEEIQRAILAVEGIISNRNTLSILSNVLLEAANGNIFITSTDLEIGVKAKIEADIQEEGSITIPAKKFSSIIRSLRSGSVSIEADTGNKVSIKSLVNKVKFTLMGASAKDFPFQVTLPDIDFFTLTQNVLKEMIQKTYFAVANDETRYVFNGIFMETQDGHIRFVSTDGRRLAFIQTPNENNILIDEGIIIPSKAIGELQKLLKGDSNISFATSNNQIFFQLDDIEMSCRLIQGKFPDYEKVIPSAPSFQALIQRKIFDEAVKRVSLMASDTSHQVKFSFQENNLVIEAQTPDLGDAFEEIEIDYNGEKVTIGFNSGYILDVLKEIDDEKLIFKFSDSEMPAIMSSEDDSNYLCVIMPLKLN